MLPPVITTYRQKVSLKYKHAFHICNIDTSLYSNSSFSCEILLTAEYGLGSEVSADGDVYSYGILLLEMMTGKKPTDEMFDGGLNLHKFARMALANQVMDIVDPTLLNNGGELAAENNRLRHSNSDRIKECLISVIGIGVACSMESPQERMEISNAVSELQMVKKALVGPRTRPYIQTGKEKELFKL